MRMSRGTMLNVSMYYVTPQSLTAFHIRKAVKAIAHPHAANAFSRINQRRKVVNSGLIYRTIATSSAIATPPIGLARRH